MYVIEDILVIMGKIGPLYEPVGGIKEVSDTLVRVEYLSAKD